MSTGYRGETEIDLDSLEGLFSGSSPTDRVVVPGLIRHRPTDELDDLLLESDGRSQPDSIALATVFWRGVRTLAPIVAADLMALLLAGAFAQFVFSYIFPDALARIGSVASFALLPLILAYALSDLYSQIWVHPMVELRQLTHVNSVGLIAAAAGAMLALPIPLWCAAAFPAVLLLVPMFRAVARRLGARFNWWGYPTLVIGAGDSVSAVADLLLRIPHSALRPVLLTDTSRKCRVSVLPVVNDHSTLESIIRAHGIRHAVLALPELSSDELSQLLERYRGLVPHLLVLSDLSTLPTLWGASRDFGRLSGIEVRNGLLLATLRFVERGLDLTVAIVCLVVGFPLLVAIAAMLRVADPGPVFYGHTRLGKHGRSFKAWKFRTMHVNSDATLREHLENNPAARNEWEMTHELRDDPRVGRIGQFLRKTSIDELPQVWNVFKGEMSLVGPRPIVQAEVCRYGNAIRDYARVKPGITGLWQVSGRNNVGYADRVLLDLFYIRHWSPWLDIYILAKTVVALISRHGAY